MPGSDTNGGAALYSAVMIRCLLSCSLLSCAPLLLADDAAKAIPAMKWEPAFQGISRAEFTLTEPRPVRAFVMKIDLSAAGVEFMATPANGEKEGETDAQKTTTFLKSNHLQAAINAGPFAPVVNTEGRGLDISGLQVCRGEVVSPQQKHEYPTLVLTRDNKARIVPSLKKTEEVWNAVSGFSIVLHEGNVVSSGPDLHPRTAAGISADGRTLYWLVVDGRQKKWSGGATTSELGEWLKTMGCTEGLNLDGGGTSTLVMDSGKGPQILNKPIHLGLPGNERPSASHLGVKALPLPVKP